MKLLLILKFFLLTNKGRFRYSFLYPLISMFVGSFIIFITFAIMNGMEKTISKNINIFNYQYYTYDTKDMDESYDNTGNEKIIMLNIHDQDNFLIMRYYSDIDSYKVKISEYIENDLNNNGVIISRYMANKFQLSIGDSINIYSPSNVKLSTLKIPYLKLPITTIYSMDSDIYDSKYMIVPIDIIKNKFLITEPIKYYSDIKSNDKYISNIKDNFLLSAISLEKKIYTSLGYLVILISCLMMFNVIVMVLMEKNKQIEFIKIIGFEDYNIYKILIFKNLFLSSVLSIIAMLCSEFIIYLNYYYGYFDIVFGNLPFKIIPISNDVSNYLILFGLINILSIISSILPYYLKNKIMKINA